jgi:CheY-like chemotaxis protein
LVRIENESYRLLVSSADMATILVVEDSEADVSLLAMALAEGHVSAQLYIAKDGAEAMTLVDEIDSSALHCPDLVVLDLNLPKFSGLAVLKRLRSSPKFGVTRVAILTTAAVPWQEREAAELGADRFLLKPMTLAGFSLIAAELKSLLPGCGPVNTFAG